MSDTDANSGDRAGGIPIREPLTLGLWHMSTFSRGKISATEKAPVLTDRSIRRTPVLIR